MCTQKHFPEIDLIPDVYSMGHVLISELVVVYAPGSKPSEKQLQKGLLGTVGARHEAAVVLMG